MTGPSDPIPAAPAISPEEQAGMQDFLAEYDRHYDEIMAHLLTSIRRLPGLAAVVQKMPQAKMDEQSRASRALMNQAIGHGQWSPLLADQRAQGQLYAGLGVRFGEWFDLVSDFQKLVVPSLVKAFGGDPPRLTRALLGMARYMDISMGIIGEAYLASKERQIAQQQHAIHELSTPVLQLRDRMLLLPIIGVLDTARARQLTHALLQAIRSARAKVVVLDITGVPAVDSKVANHLIQTVAAVRLMGAKAVITGLSGDVAQALVMLGVDLREIVTTGDLQSALEEAERMLGVRVRETAGSTMEVRQR